MSINEHKQGQGRAPGLLVMEWEKSLLGLTLTEHPIVRIHPHLVKRDNLLCAKDLPATQPGQRVKVAGVITAVQQITTRTNQPMLKVTLLDATGEIKVVVFNKALSYSASVFIDGALVVVSGKAAHSAERKRKEAAPASTPGDDEDGEQVEEEEEEASMTINFEVICDHADFVTL